MEGTISQHASIICLAVKMATEQLTRLLTSTSIAFEDRRFEANGTWETQKVLFLQRLINSCGVCIKKSRIFIQCLGWLNTNARCHACEDAC